MQLQRFLYDSSYLFISNIVATTFSIISQIVVVRLVTPDEYGRYVVALAIVNILVATFVTRTNELTLHHVGSEWAAKRYANALVKARRIKKHDAGINIAIFLCLFILSIVYAERFNIKNTYLAGLSLLIPVQTGYGVYKALFIMSGNLKKQALFEAYFGIYQSVFIIILGYIFFVPGVIAGLILAALLKNVSAFIMTKKLWPQKIENISGERVSDDIGSTLSFGTNSVISNGLANGASMGDVIILNAFQSPADVALYKVAKSLSGLPGRGFAAVWTAVRPRLLNAWHSNNTMHAFRLVFLPALLALFILGIIIWPLWKLIPTVLTLIYGEFYRKAVTIFFILLLGTWVFQGMTSWVRFWLVISNKMYFGTLLNALLFLGITAGGFVYGYKSGESMAAVVAVSMLLVSFISWVAFIQEIRRRRLQNI